MNGPSIGWFGLVVALAGARPASAQREIPLDPHLKRWVTEHAVPVPPVDEPYADSAWAFLRPMIGTAHLLAIGENIHGGHEPLALRNHIIRYAVTRLGFTAVAIESGFTEGQLVDRFVQGEPLDVDSVLRHGINNGFDRMPENKALLLWLRGHNEGAKRKVHFYGIDQTGAGAPVYGGAAAVEAALAYLGRTAPEEARRARAGFSPLVDRFTERRFRELSIGEQAALRRALTGLLRSINGRPHSANDAAHAVAVRNVWAAERLEQSFRISGAAGARSLDAIRLRDSVMAENSRWVLRQHGRAIVFAHNGHVWDVPMAFPAMGPAMMMMGTRLRRALGADLRVIGTAAAIYDGMGTVLGDMSSMESTFARAATPNYALDLRTGDRDPVVRTLLREPWITRIHAWLQPIVPRRATDILITLGRITPSAMADLADDDRTAVVAAISR